MEEKKFRNPSLLIESIQEMHLKKQDTIKTIESNLNEMHEMIDHLKTSNEFIPNVSFDKDLFGQLNLYKYSADLFKSSI